VLSWECNKSNRLFSINQPFARYSFNNSSESILSNTWNKQQMTTCFQFRCVSFHLLKPRRREKIDSSVRCRVWVNTEIQKQKLDAKQLAFSTAVFTSFEQKRWLSSGTILYVFSTFTGGLGLAINPENVVSLKPWGKKLHHILCGERYFSPYQKQPTSKGLSSNCLERQMWERRFRSLHPEPFLIFTAKYKFSILIELS